MPQLNLDRESRQELTFLPTLFLDEWDKTDSENKLEERK